MGCSEPFVCARPTVTQRRNAAPAGLFPASHWSAPAAASWTLQSGRSGKSRCNYHTSVKTNASHAQLSSRSSIRFLPIPIPPAQLTQLRVSSHKYLYAAFSRKTIQTKFSTLGKPTEPRTESMENGMEMGKFKCAAAQWSVWVDGSWVNIDIAQGLRASDSCVSVCNTFIDLEIDLSRIGSDRISHRIRLRAAVSSGSLFRASSVRLVSSAHSKCS